MIRGSDRVSSVLAKDERLVEIFVGASKRFETLRNPAMRKTMARLVTVDQAARIARIDSARLVGLLNRALGEDVSGDAPEEARQASESEPAEPATSAGIPEALRALPAERIVDLDVREDLRAGREPFQRIFETARAIPEGNVFRLRALFEPAPLYAVLAKQGYTHATEQLGEEDWRVWFHRESAPKTRAAEAPAAPVASEDGDVIVLDVRGLEPPEPMERTLEALASMPKGKTLVQLNVRVPRFLLPHLEERGFTYEVREQSADLVRLFIRHAT